MRKMAESQQITMDTVHASMPSPKLMWCHDKPTYLEMVVIQEEIYQNLAVITLPYGNGQAAFFNIVMPEVLYVPHFNKSFRQPINPGEYPNRIPASASAQQFSEILICHKAAKQVYDTYKLVIQCLCNQFQEAIHGDYLAELNNPDVGLTNVHPSIIYQHIID